MHVLLLLPLPSGNWASAIIMIEFNCEAQGISIRTIA